MSGCASDIGVRSESQTFPYQSVQPGTVEGNIRVVRALPQPDSSRNGSDLLAPNDKIEIDVFRVDELDRIVEIGADGTINLPLIGVVSAAGLSSRYLEQKIAARYRANYLQNPQVSVLVKESATRKVVVDGEVARAGVYAVTAQSSLSSVLAQAGGLRRVADPEKIYVFRTVGEERQVANYSLLKIRNASAPDPVIFGRDVIVVFPSSGKVAMRNLREALGAVRSATGIVPLL